MRAGTQNRSGGPSSLNTAVLADRYLAPGETTRNDVFKRVAHALSVAEQPGQRAHFTRLFYANLLQGAIGAGRIMANAGRVNHGTMVNCFVHPIGRGGQSVADASDVERALHQAQITLQMGGGVGYDFSVIAPVDAEQAASNSGTESVCAVLDAFDRVCATQALINTRGGAQMAVLRCDHPDLTAFVTAKRGRKRWSTFNLSVAVTDAFMRAVADDGLWCLQHPAVPNAQRLAKGARVLSNGNWCYAVVPARQLWNAITEAAHDSAEPGLLFIDAINGANDLAEIETIAATNPCGEQPLPPWGSCVLGPIDLSRWVQWPFGMGGQPLFDFIGLSQAVRVQVRMLDNAIELTRWPLPEHMHEAHAKRRIGVGVTGLADALTMMCLPYAAPAARCMAAQIGRCLRDNAYAASAALACERGSYPLFSPERSLASGHFSAALPKAVREAVARHGLRNSHLLSLAPTGSVSLAFGDNCSSGIEPAFDWVYQRRVRTQHRAPQLYRIENRAYRLFRALYGQHAALPDYFVTARQIDGFDHLRMVAALQPSIDASISKTVLLPHGMSCAEVGALLFHAWQLRLKGITIFRPDSGSGDILSVLPALVSRPACFC
ncbi:adenosylcobalamin-dependent ribonucleoside-diphosphate reductase [Ralstonia sp. CHL-2022]|uniref:Vitamin B12-dependent ribonucleotide reductase n=1 Tax=Ralstonia mojiangensis TaxID=2953895 RepID=A0AAE3I6T5_9RALS|nr:adenosylcobalamin-dependent ribonucleoside-diphosphate reductase [Ralstonia mojiangensis]MCT7318718.1 adenosylcobalamin-dependent ribonucleoside-diphosphate reductase [Ralstonia mojiangensis]